MATTLDYMEDTYRFTGESTLLQVAEDPKSRNSLILDRTIFYPQGGGQACDTGVIEGSDFRYSVQAVTFADGIVYHAGDFITGVPVPGSTVKMHVDEHRRIENARLHTAGHVLLNAMKNVGQVLIATKGYHFSDGPYVEFNGTLDEETRGVLLVRLQEEVDRLIAADIHVTATFVPVEQVHAIAMNVPANIPLDKPTRVVTIADVTQPCGGTHIKSLGTLAGMQIEKIRSKKGETRISYILPTL